jgi:trimeric autotransporter adhesin
MTPDKQVSPAIRISQGERDASARATHLEAATRKFLVTTNERKQMSTKTNFKRIALVAVAALGMGVLSSVPSQALYLTTPTLTLTAGSPTKASSDSRTAGTISVTWNTDAAAAGNRDTITITAVPLSYPALATAVPRLNLMFSDTTGTTGGALTAPQSSTAGTLAAMTSYGGQVAATDSVSATAVNGAVLGSGTITGAQTMKLFAFLDTTQARQTGTYSYTIILTQSGTQYGAGSKNTATPITGTLSLTVAALTSESTVASAGQSSAFIHNAASGVPTVDNTASVLATASTTARAWLYVNLANTGGAQASESVTLTTTIGNFGPSGGASVGKQIVVEYASSGAKYYPIFADGTAGTAVITVKSASVTFANKSLTFYAAAPTTLVAKALNTNPGVGINASAVEVVAKDANGNLWGGSLAIYSDTLATISDTGTACVNANTAVGAFLCPVTGVVAGTAKVKVYASAQTVVSNEISLTVKQASAATVKLSWDKATYAPGEKATLRVEVLDSAGTAVQNGTFANLFATGGITLSTASGNGSDTLTAVSITTSTSAQDYVGTSTTGAKLYTVYMPPAGGTFTASATGGTSLPAAGQVKVTATATVTDSGAAALAAVTALATQVASLRTLITTLTNLVLKIQKKVKA